ncbi:MAG: amidohydrolase [Chloroflexota bacterium]
MRTPITRRTAIAGAAALALAGANAAAQEATPGPEVGSGPITIFQAKKILTMDPNNPEAEYVAVRDGRILGAGPLDQLEGWGDYTLDDTFKDHILTPGMIEAHAHPMEGMVEELVWVGYYDRLDSKGNVIPGVGSYDDFLTRMKEAEAKLTDPNAPLGAAGWDPIFFMGDANAPTFDAAFLDQISSTRQIAVWWLNNHDFTVNTAVLKANNIDASVKVPGVIKDAQGNPTGQLNETPAIGLAKSIAAPIIELMNAPKTIGYFGQFGLNAGLTTINDHGSSVLADPKAAAAWQATVNEPTFPCRVTAYVDPTMPGANVTPEDLPKAIQALQAKNTEKFMVTGVKLVLDGSLQAGTAKVKWPGYYKIPNDQMELLIAPEQVNAFTVPLHQAGIQISYHCNGDVPVDVALDAIDAGQAARNWPDNRHAIQHSQITSYAQYRRMAELGAVVNIFANHIWYYGDQHYEWVLGPERALQMEKTGTARDLGIPLSIHCDTSTTPLGPLAVMWSAVNRLTPKGRQFAVEEKLTAQEALQAVTLGAATVLKLDDVLGSIENGKHADFTVLEEDPLTVDPLKIRDIKVWGTVLGGVKQQAAGVANAYQLPKSAAAPAAGTPAA